MYLSRALKLLEIGESGSDPVFDAVHAAAAALGTGERDLPLDYLLCLANLFLNPPEVAGDASLWTEIQRDAELLTYPSGALNSLSGGTSDQIVSLGKVDISSAILSGRATARLNEQSHAEFAFYWRLAGFVDYAAPLIVQRPGGSEPPTVVFYGDVGTAEVDDGVARVVAAGMEQLRESILPAFSGANLHPTEIVYTIMRLAGLKNHQMKIEGGPEPIVEVFEILRPVVNFAPT
jgi:hypothetical protein